MTLRQQQSLFVTLVARLITHATNNLGYDLTFGEAWRPPEMAAIYAKQGKGVVASLHGDRLAIDINLFKDGVYMSSTESHRTLGEWWVQQHVLCRWGGNFKPRADGNHYSLTRGGRA